MKIVVISPVSHAKQLESHQLRICVEVSCHRVKINAFLHCQLINLIIVKQQVSGKEVCLVLRLIRDVVNIHVLMRGGF